MVLKRGFMEILWEIHENCLGDFYRKFRSQTSDNMDRWKSRGGKSQRREEKMKEDQRRERVGGKKMQVREKVQKSRNTVFSQWFVAPEGRKVGWLKRRVRSHLARWEMKKCTPSRREAHFRVKMYKAYRSRSTFGSWDDEKVHVIVARSTFRSQNDKKTTCSDHFRRFRCGFAWQVQGIPHPAKVSRMWGFSSMSKNDGRPGTFQEDLQRCISRGRRSTRDMFIIDVRRSGC